MGNEKSGLTTKDDSVIEKRQFSSVYHSGSPETDTPKPIHERRRFKTEYHKEFNPTLLLDRKKSILFDRELLSATRKTALQPPVNKTTPWNYKCQGTDWDIEGVEQSPIDISVENLTYSPEHTLKIEWRNKDCKVKILNNGFNIIFNGNLSKIEGVTEHGKTETFDAFQFHFHWPAEHLLEGKRYPLELHIVHQIVKEQMNETVTRNLSVVGIFFEVDENAEPNAFLDALQLDELKEMIEFNPHEFFGDIIDPLFFSYKGGLTTPPCGQSVNWFVLPKPLKMTAKQLERFTSKNESLPYLAESQGNYRECQPLNGRTIYCGNCADRIEELKEIAQAHAEKKESVVNESEEQFFLFSRFY